MKQYIYLLFLLVFVANLPAQIVNIPDINFKNKLIGLGIDTNNDNQIQVTEAEAITNLYFSVPPFPLITDLTGIEAFVNLDTFSCSGTAIQNINLNNLINLKCLSLGTNSLTSLNLSNLPNLAYLNCFNNMLSSMYLSNLPQLTYLRCGSDSLSNLSITNCPNLIEIDCQDAYLTNLDVSSYASLEKLRFTNNKLQSLDVSNLTHLKEVICDENKIQSLNVSNCINLEKIICSDNLLSNLDVSNLTNFQHLQCQKNSLTNLNVNNCLNLMYLHCQENLLTNIDISDCINLVDFHCNKNQLTSMSLTNLPLLQSLWCGENPLQSLNLSNLTGLQSLFCWKSQLQTLDVSTLTSLGQLICDSNQLATLFIKNGISEINLGFGGNPNLQYICVDATDIGYVQQQAMQYGMSNVSINSFCSFTPGGNYNTLSGKSIYDANINGCTVLDSAYPYLQVAFTDGININYGCTDMLGNYEAFLDSGSYTFTPQFQNPTYFSSNPISTSIYFSNDSNNVQTQDFCIIPNGVFPDVEIVLSPLNPARPGFDASYQLFFHNKGTNTVSGDIIVDFMGNNMFFVSSSQALSSQSANQLIWNYSNLQPFESRSIAFVMHLLPPPTNNIGDELGFSAYIPLANDVYSNDNHSDLKQPVVGSYDPNDKTCLEGNYLLNNQIGEYLHYLIRFQNTGNYYAENVVVVDSIDIGKLDIASLQILETSHNAHISVNDGVLQFYFEEIMLEDSFTNEPASHGYVLFKIRTKGNLPINSSVGNKAEIYFDYNLPVLTNTEIVTFGYGLGLDNGMEQPLFQVYPNPVERILTIESADGREYIVLNVLGEVVMERNIVGKGNLDVSGLVNGVYWILLKDRGWGQMFVKE